jgi:hypothetical protein
MREENVPAMQSAHVEVPATEYFPLEQRAQLDAPDELKYDPALQFAHDEAPAVEYVPAVHNEQLEAPAE